MAWLAGIPRHTISRQTHHPVLRLSWLPVVLLLVACGAGSAEDAAASVPTASGSPIPDTPVVSELILSATPTAICDGAAIDMSHASEGSIVASALSDGPRLKLAVTCGQMTYAYDMPITGEQIVVPVNMGDGTYCVQVMRNVEGNNYVEALSATEDVQLASEFAPFLVPNMFCLYSEGSQCVKEARRIASESGNQGELAQGICEYVMQVMDYDTNKAAAYADATGYVPNPDGAMAEGKGICFDYASLCAAMFRSTGIPAKLVTGYVGNDRIYHSWVEAYVDGKWTRFGMSVGTGRWSRLDVTIADSQSDDPGGGAGSSSNENGNLSYETRYVY